MKGYIKREDRKKILLLSDDVRMQSGISTVAREIIAGTAHIFNWVNLGAAINHPEKGKKMVLDQSLNELLGIDDASVVIYPFDGYGNPDVVRWLIDTEKPDAILFFTDPRYWTWLFNMENEIRKKIPMIYLQIWDDLPAPIYNKSYYESCDSMMAISKQTLNINRMVLGDLTKDKVLSYVPHGINETHFFPIDESMQEPYKKMQQVRSTVFGSEVPEFVVFYNARNIRRKSTSDLIAAYAYFCDTIGRDAAKKCALVLHTQVLDENGTDLMAVKELLCDPEHQRVYFSENRLSNEDLNILYNISDVTCLISSNEGWGLSITEAMMAGRMIIANVTGGMQDQMRFVDEDGKWIDFTDQFPSNHFGRYRECGIWAVPVFPSNISMLGSIQTPYIFDDRCNFMDVAAAIKSVYDLPKEERDRRGATAREWVTSSESMMSARLMCKNVVEHIDKTFENFVPREDFELIKTQDRLPRKKLLHPLVY